MMTRGCHYIFKNERESLERGREREGGNFCCFQDLMYSQLILVSYMFPRKKRKMRRRRVKEDHMKEDSDSGVKEKERVRIKLRKDGLSSPFFVFLFLISHVISSWMI